MNKKIWIISLFFSMLVLFTGCMTVNTSTSSTTTVAVVETKEAVEEETSKNEESKNTIQTIKEDIVEGKEFSLLVSCGYGGLAKYGRDMGVLATITNHGSDFVGDLWVLIPTKGTGSQNTLFKKEFAIAKGETKKVELAVPVLFSTGKINVSIRDKSEKERASLDVKVNVQGNTETMYIGVLSDSHLDLSYFTDEKTKTFYMGELPENKKSLDMLDVIVMNNFNTSIFNANQYEALKAFVKQGGTLVVGTGATGIKTLEGFQDDFLTGTMGTIQNVNLALGSETKKVEKEILAITLDNSIDVYTENDVSLMQKVNVGKGNIQLFTFDLGLESSVWNTKGKYILEKITEQLSSSKKTQLNMELKNNNYFYELRNSLEIVTDSITPKMSKYSIVLGIYLFLVGPLLYIVLKKLDKRNLTWVLVPAFSVVFSLVVYIMGTDTRISKPYVQYVTFSNIENGIESEELLFTLTAPYNNAYQVTVPAEYEITLPVTYDYYGSYNYDKRSNEYDMSIGYGAEVTTLNIQNQGAFEPAYFSASSMKDTESLIETNISLKEESENEISYTGTVTNKLGYNLESAILCVESNYFLLGDIANGETKKIEDCKVYPIYSIDGIWNTDLIELAVGGNIWGNSNKKKLKQYYALEYKFRTDFEDNLRENYLIGVTEDSSNPVIDAIGLKASGIKLMTTSVQVNYQTKQNEIYIPYLDNHYKITVLNGTYATEYRYIHSELLELEVQFGKEDKITSLIYPKASNPENNGIFLYEGFYCGTIDAFNYKTGQYEMIFESGKPSKLTNIKPYLSKNNTMRLQFNIDESARNTDSISLPVLAVTKEAK